MPFSAGGFTRRDAALPNVRGKVHAVIGMRRSGKTTFLKQLLTAQKQSRESELSLYISFDDDRLADVSLADLSHLIEEYYRRYPELRGRETICWYLDEIQLVQGWERFVRRIMDTERVEIVVSGSSARMLSREVHTSLRGRGIDTVIRPYSFREFLRHRGEEPSRGPRRWTPAERSRIEKRFLEFLSEGGFPEVQGLPAPLRIELLQGYVNTVLFRDIVERYGVTQVAALRWLIRHCLRNPAAAYSIHRLYNDLKSQGHAIAKDTVYAFLEHILDSFLLSSVPLATDSERRRNSNPRKLYPADTGLIGAFDMGGRANTGHALESAILTEIERRKADIGYVKTDEGHEIDFLARYPARGAELIQVCSDISNEATLKRELRALREARDIPHKARKLLLVLTHEHALSFIGTGIDAVPAYEWMLPDEGE